VKQRSPLQIAELQARLSCLRETSAWLASHATIGRELRLNLAAAGSPTWSPAEDLSWRSWVACCGDDNARELLAAIDELLEERAAELGVGDER
jgi:hypothetical protein